MSADPANVKHETDPACADAAKGSHEPGGARPEPIISSDYSATIAAAFCELIGEGYSLPKAAAELGAKPRLFYGWLARKEPAGGDEFRRLYEAAKFEREQLREDRADELFAEALEIADDSSSDTITRTSASGREYEAPDHEWIARCRLRVETRMKQAAKLAPKRYGEKLELAGDANAPLSVIVQKFTPQPNQEPPK